MSTIEEQREPYLLLTALLVMASLIFLTAWALFAKGFPYDEQLLKTAGWLMGPFVWALVTAYRKWRSMPVADRDSPQLMRVRKCTAIAWAFLGICVLIAVSGVIAQIIQVRSL